MPILNPHHEPYLQFAEEERRQGRRHFSPWTTSDPELLNIAKQFFPEVPIFPADSLEKPDLTPVDLVALKDYEQQFNLPQEAYYIAVGGPPAAAVALQHALNGKPVLYASDVDTQYAGKMVRPIWAGAGNHGEPDALTEGPAYIAGHQPLKFIMKEVLRLFFPTAYETAVLNPDYPWLSMNWLEWLKNPRQWPAAFRVAWGNHHLSTLYAQALKKGEIPEIIHEMRNRTQASWDYLEMINKKFGGLMREPRGSLLIASTPKQVENLKRDRERLKAEGRELLSLTPEQAQEKYGLTPCKAMDLMEKTHDFVFEPDFLKKISEQIQVHGGEIKTKWRLKRVYIDTEKMEGGILEFCELNSKQEKISHYRKFTEAHLSLGPTPFHPRVYDLISVTGVSMNALIIGADFNGGPIVCGGTNHLVPLMSPRLIEIKDPKSGELKTEKVTFARISAAASVSPLDRGKKWYTYDGRHAVHLLHRIRETLPQDLQVKILSVTGCNRVIGKDGRQVEIHPLISVDNKKISCDSVTIQIGAGGGGLTQMGAVPQRLIKEK